jgi:hypothetical protein
MPRQVRTITSVLTADDAFTGPGQPIVYGGADALAVNDGNANYVGWVPDGFTGTSHGVAYGELAPFTIPTRATDVSISFLVAADWPSLDTTARLFVELDWSTAAPPATGTSGLITHMVEGNPLDYDGLTVPGWITTEYPVLTPATVAGSVPLLDALNLTGLMSGYHLTLTAGTIFGGHGSYATAVTYLAVAVDYTIGTLPLRQRQRRDGLKSAGRGRQASSRQATNRGRGYW